MFLYSEMELNSYLPDWDNLPSPLLQAVLWLVLRDTGPLQFPGFLNPGSELESLEKCQIAAVNALASVNKRWRAAVAAALAEHAVWAVTVQRSAGVALQRLDRVRLQSLDVRVLTWSEADGGSAVEALLSSPQFQQRSSSFLASVAGVPERLAPLLAAFPCLSSVGLAEDYSSTAFGVSGPGAKSHLAPMQLAPLLRLPLLTSLTLELGVADLAQLPAGVTQLTLVEVDRIVLRPAVGNTVIDRLVATAEATGLSALVLRSASGGLVIEEAHRAPLELELSHAARLLAVHDGRWSVSLGLHLDEALQQRLPQLALARLPAAAG